MRRDQRMPVDTYMRLNGRFFWNDFDYFRKLSGELDSMEYGESGYYRKNVKKIWREGAFPTMVPESQKIDHATEEEQTDQRRSFGMVEHELKCWPQFFWPTVDGEKSFEYRKDDRNFRKGDVLVLREWRPVHQVYTGHALRMRIRKVWRDIPGLPMGFCIMTVKFIEHLRPDQSEEEGR